MKNKLTSIKTLPLLAVFATGLVLSPTLAMADDDDRGHSKHRYSQENHQARGYANKHGNRHGERHNGSRHYNKHYGHRDGYAHNKHYYRRDDHRGHRHSTYIVNDYYDNDYYLLDPLRFMIGLHTNNVDIIFRD